MTTEQVETGAGVTAEHVGTGDVEDSAVGPSGRQRLRAARGPTLLVVLVLLAGTALALLAARPAPGTLRPDAPGPQGSLALATLLRAQGVAVTPVTDLPAPSAASPSDADRAVLVALPDRMSTAQRDALARSRADLVLVAPDAAALGALARGVTAARAAQPEVTTPACPVRAAAAAGPVDLTGVAYTGPPGAVTCYPVGDAPGASLVVVRDGTRTVTVVGDSTPFTNAALDRRGNAALTLGLLGAHPRLDWYLPAPPPAAPGQQRSLLELVPAGWLWGAVQLLVAGVVLVGWRARRLGPLVAERLPVIVHADETMRGRARLYRRVGARDRAAEALRADARRDLAARLGVPRGSLPAALADAVAARTGRSPAAVTDLLHGRAPADDRALVALAAALDVLVGEVRGAHDPIT